MRLGTVEGGGRREEGASAPSGQIETPGAWIRRLTTSASKHDALTRQRLLATAAKPLPPKRAATRDPEGLDLAAGHISKLAHRQWRRLATRQEEARKKHGSRGGKEVRGARGLLQWLGARHRRSQGRGQRGGGSLAGGLWRRGSLPPESPLERLKRPSNSLSCHSYPPSNKIIRKNIFCKSSNG